MSGRARRIAAITAAPVMLLAALVAAAWILVRPANPGAADVIVTIPPGATSLEIGHRLEAAGVARRASSFALVARLRGVSRVLREGEYRLSPAMTLLEIVDRIARGDVVLHPLTIPEGFTAEQIVQRLAGAELGDVAQLREIVRHGAPSFPHPFLRDLPIDSLEGYLFPDTYAIPRFLSAGEVIAIFLDRFSEVVVPAWREAGSGRSLHEIVTMASLVEREAKVPAERPLIAGVLYNRLTRGWRLEVDATVLYALGRHKPIVTFEDLKVASPYNTYLHAGLPPGPIANPGLAAIRAALRPQATEYLYYVARPDGSHVFSRTLSEHLVNVRRYRRP